MSGVLVTGATTPLGAALVRRLLDRPIDHVLAVGIEPEPALLPRQDRRLRYVQTDLTRHRNVSQLLFGPARELGIEAVVHTALHRRLRGKARELRALNVGTTRDLLELCERHPTIRRLIHRSFSEVYRVEQSEPSLLDEDAPLEIGSLAPQRIRDRVEADVTACTRMGMSPLRVIVLRYAEVPVAGTGSQLWDYLQSPVCLRPLGFDPMINVLSPEDAARAILLALDSDAQGVFNIPGADTLPLSMLIRLWGRTGVPLPGPLLAPLYRLRTRAVGMEFSYDLNMTRFHFGGVLDGARARAALGYQPQRPMLRPGATGARADRAETDRFAA